MRDPRKRQFLDPLELERAIKQEFRGYDLAPMQEFARRIGIKNYMQPSVLYDYCNSKQLPSLDWIANAAEVLGIPPHRLWSKEYAKEVFAGFVADLRESSNGRDLLNQLFTIEENILREERTDYAAAMPPMFNRRAIVRDKSMEPIFHKNTEITISSKNELHPDNDIDEEFFLVEFARGGFTLRCVIHTAGEDTYHLNPENPRFDATIANKNDIAGLYRVISS